MKKKSVFDMTEEEYIKSRDEANRKRGRKKVPQSVKDALDRTLARNRANPYYSPPTTKEQDRKARIDHLYKKYS